MDKNSKAIVRRALLSGGDLSQTGGFANGLWIDPDTGSAVQVEATINRSKVKIIAGTLGDNRAIFADDVLTAEELSELNDQFSTHAAPGA